ncbi:MAG: hypothetical protein DCF22_00530 [Leptolyngbya sp.]|nr:MAG: hypothetical protein DCF22_00530 [Leptolyngbya sp.]
MDKRRQAAIAALAVCIISALELPAEARRRYGGYRSRSFHAERGPARRTRRRPVVAAARQYYQPASFTVAQIDRSGVSAARPTSVAKQRRSAPQGDDRFPLRPEPSLRREPTSEVTEVRANSLNGYAKKQPHQAMRKLLGKPSRATEGTEVYELQGTGSPYQASKRLVIHYERSADCNYTCRVTSSWHVE